MDIDKVRDKHTVKDELDDYTDSQKKSRVFFFMCILAEIGMLYLFMQFVLFKGNLFDYILSSCVLLFFVIVGIYQIVNVFKSLKKRKILAEEYKIACMSKEERKAYERSQKFSRILEKVEEN